MSFQILLWQIIPNQIKVGLLATFILHNNLSSGHNNKYNREALKQWRKFDSYHTSTVDQSK